jgi:preprotein translocase subunit SecB
MKSSLLKIDGYVFKKVHLEAFDAPEPENWQVESKVEVLRRKDDARNWLVELTVNFKGDKPETPYIGEFKVLGRFHCAEEAPEASCANLVNVNGPSVLYSAVRELVLQLTARGPHRNVLLPSVTFIDRKELPKNAPAQAAGAQESKDNPDQVNAF